MCDPVSPLSNASLSFGSPGKLFYVSMSSARSVLRAAAGIVPIPQLEYPAEYRPSRSFLSSCEAQKQFEEMNNFLLPRIATNSLWNQAEETLQLTIPTADSKSRSVNLLPTEPGKGHAKKLYEQRGRGRDDHHDKESGDCIRYPPIEAFSKLPKIPFPDSSMSSLQNFNPFDGDDSFEALAMRFNCNRDNFIFY